MHKTGGEKWAEYITVSGAGLASGVILPSYIVYRVDQQVHYMELAAVLRWNRQTFYQGL